MDLFSLNEILLDTSSMVKTSWGQSSVKDGMRESPGTSLWVSSVTSSPDPTL